MQLGKMFVKIKLETDIRDEDDSQHTSIEAKGELFQTERQTVIRFTEKTADQPDVMTMVTIKQNQVTVKRSGGVEMNQQFRLDQMTETIYRHQFGSIRMETATTNLQYQQLTNRNIAKLTLNYKTTLDGAEEREHALLLMIEEDNS